MKEVIIYIHGITPSPKSKPHTPDYEAFEKVLTKQLNKHNKRYPDHSIYIEWGSDLPSNTTNDRKLAPTENILLQKVNEISDKHCDCTINPLRLVYNVIRKNFVLGFADMFYYVSEDGKAEIRKNVLSTVLNKLPPLENGEVYSFTIVSHSAGTVIMHDLLFIIFGGSSNSYLTDPNDKNLLKGLQNYANNGRVHIKCFVTMGSPITPLIVRSKTLLDALFAGQRLDPDRIGIRPSTKGDSSHWLNFWDKDDIISYPLAFLYNNPNNLIEDYYINIGGFFPSVHNAYWSSEKVAKIIAKKY